MPPKVLKWALLFAALVLVGGNSEEVDRSEESRLSLRGKSMPFSDRFPSISETVEMSKLSSLVYDFKDKPEDYCSTFSNAQGIKCHWYFHDTVFGTQVMIVSSPRQRYLAIVFAGTNDLITSLEDMDISKKPFGNNSTVRLSDPNIKVHQGFDNSVFSGVYSEIERRLKRLWMRYPLYKLYTTGHSLGAADSILTATALAEHAGYSVVSINFGCPKTGNREWREYLNGTSTLNPRLAIWRIVLGWDLVARLPQFFDHVGHTIQLWSEDHYKYDEDEPNMVECYYRHYGDEELQYAGVPSGWDAKPYAWMPGAISYHFVQRYVDYLEILSQKQLWVTSFKDMDTNDNDDYNEPPDDWYVLDEYDYNSVLLDDDDWVDFMGEITE